MIKQYKAEEKQKIKDEAKAAKEKAKNDEKLAKQKAKDDAKLAKELEKQKLKEEKLKAKEMSKNSKKSIINENVVIGPSNIEIESTNGCVAIIKSGPNKGKQCGCEIKSQNMCFRHAKVNNNNINKDIKI